MIKINVILKCKILIIIFINWLIYFDLDTMLECYFPGVLMGIAIRTGSPLSLNLAEPVWKQLAGMTLTPADLTEVDRDYVPGMFVYFQGH